MGLLLMTTIFNWRLLRKEDSQQVYYLVAVPKDAVDRFIESLRLAGLKPFRLELSGFALARAVEVETAVAMNVESDTIELIIMVEKVPLVMFTKSLEEIVPMGQEVSPFIVEELRRVIDYHNDRNPGAPLGSHIPISHTHLCLRISGI